MDLLCKAYSNDSDDEPEPKPVNYHHVPFRPSKRPKPENPFPTVDIQKRDEAPVTGRYVSKRERALSVSVPTAAEPNPNHQELHLFPQPGTSWFYILFILSGFLALVFVCFGGLKLQVLMFVF